MPDPVIGPVAEGDTFKVIFFQRLYNQRIMNVLHYSCVDAGTTPPDVFQVCKLLEAKLTDPVSLLTDLLVVQVDDLTHTSCRVQVLRAIDATYPFWERSYTKPGTYDGAAGTANLCASIEKRATFDPPHPRQGIGRMAIAGIPQVGFEAGLLKNDYKATFNGLLEDMTDSVTVDVDTILAPCLSHKGALNWIDNPIFQCNLKDEVRDMTRRTVGRGI